VGVLAVAMIGLVVFVVVDGMLHRRVRSGSALSSRPVQLALGGDAGLFVAVVFYAAFVGGGASVLNPYPKFSSLTTHPTVN
jgi:hypothetical protein